MASCPRCHAHACTLETVGVFRCPACGRVDADGEALADGATEAARFATQAGDSSFAAPLPLTTPARGSGAPIPRPVLLLIGVQALLAFGALTTLGADAIAGITVRVFVLGGLLVGDRSSYRAACLSSVLGLVLDAYRFSTWSWLGLVGHAFVVICLAFDLASIGVLFSSETRKHYEKSEAR